MAESEVPIPELEDILKRSPPGKRAEVLSGITDLFVSECHRYAPEHVAVFDNVLCRLIDDSDAEALVILARRLAPVTKAPVRVIGRLAHMDDLAIAEPVLMHSTRIEDAVLSYVAKTKSQEHRMAIACRSQIDPSITDTLIEHGDDVVVRYVANNSGARFSEAGLRSLARRAETDGALAEQLHKRRDAPPWLKTMLARHSGSTEKRNARHTKAGRCPIVSVEKLSRA